MTREATASEVERTLSTVAKEWGQKTTDLLEHVHGKQICFVFVCLQQTIWRQDLARLSFKSSSTYTHTEEYIFYGATVGMPRGVLSASPT